MNIKNVGIGVLLLMAFQFNAIAQINNQRADSAAANKAWNNLPPLSRFWGSEASKGDRNEGY